MEEFNHKESVMLASSNLLLPPASLSLVNEENDQTPTTTSASPQTALVNWERLPEAIRRDLEPQSLNHISILDLPDELLINIFEHATGSPDISNVRLACRRLCGTSSHLLIDCLNVCLTAASLARAQEISRHPTISRGIRALHISLQSHSHISRGWEFLRLATKELDVNIRQVLRNLPDVLEDENASASAKFYPILRERQRLLSSWEDYLHTRRYCKELLPHDLTPDMEVLRQGYEKYKSAYKWQQRCIQDGTFAQAIAAVVGRVPKATKLLFTNRFRYLQSCAGHPRNLWKSYTRRCGIFDDRMTLSIGASTSRPASGPTELAVQVPLAIHRAGVSTIEIEVQSFQWPGFSPRSTWIRDQSQLPGLKAAAESLKVFTFADHTRYRSIPAKLSNVSKYLRVILGAGNIEVLSLDLPRFHGNPGPDNPDMGFLLASLRWPRLREVYLGHGSFHLPELKTFIEQLQPRVFLNLWQINLLSGTWAEGLDILRTRADPKSEVHYLEGAECDSISPDQLDRILPDYDAHQVSWASQYIRGASIRNPFLVAEDETTDEGTNADTI